MRRQGGNGQETAGGKRQGARKAGRAERKRQQAAMKESVRERKRGNRQILCVTYGVVAVFLCMAGYLAYFTAVDSETIINNSRNKRQQILAEKVTKGSIYSQDGVVLAETVTGKNGKERRSYPEGKKFCHVVGRTDNSLTGIELSQCYPMLTSHTNPLKQLGDTLRGEKSQGDNVYTTLDADLQRAAYSALGEHRGAIVALEPDSGKVLAMVSRPAYDPNTVSKDWDRLVEDDDEESKLVNRATQGLYPPGSTFKMVTAMEYMLENADEYKDYRFKCSGTRIFSGSRINCYGKERHGSQSLTVAFAKSCNGAFADLGTKLDLKSFQKFCEKLYFNKSVSYGFETNPSKFSLKKGADTAEVTQTAIGQGRTLITPLENAMITAMVANRGEMMKPYVVDRVESASGRVIKQYEPESKGKLVDEWVTEALTSMMEEVVNQGTGRELKNLSCQAAGKTGSAEVDSDGTTHAWFVGFAPSDHPKLVVSIVVEGAGTGGRYAVPIAKQLFREYLD